MTTTTESRNPAPATAPTPFPLEAGGGRRLLQIPILVILADWLFYGQPLGWTIGLFGALLVLVLVLSQSGRNDGWPARLLVLGVLSLCIRCVFEPNRLTIVLGLLLLVSLALTLREGWQGNCPLWIMRWGHFIVGSLETCIAVPHAAALHVRSWNGSNSHGRLLRAWLVPLGMGIAFVALFAMANPIIANCLTSAWKQVAAIFDELPSPLRILFWLGVASGLLALLNVRTEVHDVDTGWLEDGLPGDCAGFLTPAVIRRALVVFNLLFAVQTAMDICYLWGGTALPPGMSHAEYAHRGAYPLVATALLAGAFVLATCRAGTSPPELRLARRLVYLWLCQNVFLVVSAGWRLWLYVNTYSLTRLRVAACIWMLLVAGGLMWIVVRILASRSNLWLVNVNTITMLAVLLACCWAGIDPHIAHFNVRHCREVGRPDAPAIDLKYLSKLGYDSLPALIWLAEQPTTKTAAIRNLVDKLAPSLDEDLRNWRGWTRRRAAIQAKLGRWSVNLPGGGESKVGKQDRFAFGKISAIADNTVTLKEYDVAHDAYAEVAYLASPATEYGNVSGLADLQVEDDIVLDYAERNGHRWIVSLVRGELVEPTSAAP